MARAVCYLRHLLHACGHSHRRGVENEVIGLTDLTRALVPDLGGLKRCEPRSVPADAKIGGACELGRLLPGAHAHGHQQLQLLHGHELESERGGRTGRNICGPRVDVLRH